MIARTDANRHADRADQPSERRWECPRRLRRLEKVPGRNSGPVPATKAAQKPLGAFRTGMSGTASD
jgi:hypothetical protein